MFLKKSPYILLMLSTSRFCLISACKMVCVKFILCVFVLKCVILCCGQFLDYRYDPSPKAIPFPTCKADDLECLRRGLRTFFFLMDSRHLGMKPVDPAILNSVAVTMPEQQMSFLLRNLNVTGARWTKLVNRRFDLSGIRNEAIFVSDLHVTGDIIMTMADRLDPFMAYLTMDIHGVETNLTYSWRAQRGIDNQDYILIGQERIAIRNRRLPTFFLQPNTQESMIIEKTLELKQSVVDHLANEITAALMHSILDNFRLFARSVPVLQYYKFY